MIWSRARPRVQRFCFPEAMGEHNDHRHNPMQHPDEQPVVSNQTPQFGKLLLVLAAAVLLLALITWASVAYVT